MAEVVDVIATERENRGLEIAQAKESQVLRVDENFYTVKSQSGNGEYVVCKVDGEWTCQCPDHTHRHVVCKHIHAVASSLSVRAEVAVNRVIPELNVNACQYCGASEIVRDGVRHNKQGDIQVYVCKKCGKHTTLNLGFKGMRATPQIITSAMQLYFTGESYRNIQNIVPYFIVFLSITILATSHHAILLAFEWPLYSDFAKRLWLTWLAGGISITLVMLVRCSPSLTKFTTIDVLFIAIDFVLWQCF